MSVTLYLAIGHGKTPDGHDDPGAVHGKLVEHELARQVVDATYVALRRSGFYDFIAEQSRAGQYDDPDYRGSVIAANRVHAAYVVEVHFNAGSSSGHGGEVLYYPTSLRGRDLARALALALSKTDGLTNRGLKSRDDLWLLRGTTGVAIIPEIAFVDGDAATIESHPALCTKAGEAIARTFLAFIGRRYVPPGSPQWLTTWPAGESQPVYHHLLDDALADAKHRLSTDKRDVLVGRHAP